MDIQVIGNGNIVSNNFYSSFLINGNILIDAPPGLTKQLKNMNKDLSDIDIIVITHLHGDHYFDLPFIILNEYSKNREKDLFIIGPKELKKELNKLTKLAFKNNISKYLDKLKIHFIDALTVQNREIGNNIFLSSIKVKHDNVNSYGYLLKKDDNTLAITGDTEMCPGLTYMLKKASVCLIDVNNVGKHLTLEQLKEIIKEYPIKYIPVHFPDDIEDELTLLKNVRIIKIGEHFYL